VQHPEPRTGNEVRGIDGWDDGKIVCGSIACVVQNVMGVAAPL
jgi:hypothetical protein